MILAGLRVEILGMWGQKLRWRLALKVLGFTTVISGAVASWFLYPIKDAGHVAAWAQAIASAIAISWAGQQSLQQLKLQRAAQKKAAIELAVGILRSVHGHLLRVGRSRWWGGERLRQVAIGKNFFRVEYLDPIEKMLDQVNLEHLDNQKAIEIMVAARAKIWRIRELLTWIIENGREVDARVNGAKRFESQAKAIEGQVRELRNCFNQLIQIMNSYEPLPVVDS